MYVPTFLAYASNRLLACSCLLDISGMVASDANMERSPLYQLFEVLDTFSLSNFFGFGLYSATIHIQRGIIKAITELDERGGSSSTSIAIAIKKHMQAEMGDKKWLNGIFLKALKDGVASGDFIKVKASYELSPAAKKAYKQANKATKTAKNMPDPIRRLGVGDPSMVSDLYAANFSTEQNPPMLGGSGMFEARDLASAAFGVATIVAVGLYLFKKKRTKN
eukprot:scaffold11205_cov221-Skeletonema_dohrnii-CCMP3373.AAC.3